MRPEVLRVLELEIRNFLYSQRKKNHTSLSVTYLLIHHQGKLLYANTSLKIFISKQTNKMKIKSAYFQLKIGYSSIFSCFFAAYLIGFLAPFINIIVVNNIKGIMNSI